MNKKLSLTLALSSLSLLACGGLAPNSESSASTSSGGNESTSSAVQSSESSSAVQSSESSSATQSSESSSQRLAFQVTFFDGESKVALGVDYVYEGECVERPEDPSKTDYSFINWYKDADYEEEFDFTLPIMGNTAIYAKFELKDYFEGYSLQYIPNYSPLVPAKAYYQGESDVELIFEAQGVSLSSNVTPRQVLLSGALQGLEVKDAFADGKLLHVQTTGTLGEGEGYLTLARDSTMSDAFISGVIDVLPRGLRLDEYGYRVENEEKAVYFTIAMDGMSLSNPESLSVNDYVAKVNADVTSFMRIEGAEGYGLSLTGVNEDFTSFALKLQSPKDIDEGCAKEIGNLNFILAAGASNIAQEQVFKLDLLTPGTKTDVTLSYSGPLTYAGQFSLTLFGSKLSEELKNGVATLLSEPTNKDAIISFDGCETILKSLTLVDDNHLEGKFDVTYVEDEPRLAKLCLNAIPVGENPLPLVTGLFPSSNLPPMELASAELGYDQESVGTITQTASSSYKGVRSVIEHYAFQNDTNDEVGEIVSKATDIGKIGYALYSGDTTSARYALGDLLGDDSLRNPTSVMMETLQTILEELKVIEDRIVGLSEQLTAIEEELKSIGEEALLSNFLDAYSIWKAFVSDYYTPLSNIINDYTNFYFRHMYDLVVSSSSVSGEGSPEISIYYDIDGKLAFPDEHLAFSVDGKSLDLNATKVVKIPELYYALSGLRANSGHVYSDIEEDIVADLLSRPEFDQAILKDLVKTIRFQAMKSYFSSLEKINGFTNTFTNFCTAFTGSELDSPLHGSFTPLDSFVTMQETIFNFGFEVEPDLNIVTSKLASTYYCAKSILNFALIINNGEIASSKYENLDKAFQEEIKSPRFHHENDENGNIYCFATKSYIRYRLDQIGITGSKDGYLSDIARVPYGEEYEYNKGVIASNDFSSIAENELKLMRLKVKLYNRIKKTAYTFREYLLKIRMIPNEAEVVKNLFGIIFSIDGVVYGDDAKDLSFALGFNSAGFGRWGPTGDPKESSTNGPDIISRGFSLSALKGKLYSLDDDQVYTGLLALSVDYDKDPYFYLPFLSTAYYTGILKPKAQEGQSALTEPTSCYGYFINFEPLNA
ncbi:MAG: InlB B-repeat-containing protein [Bacilli bacterium]|nr:InlB B-repeat-containing protein [Bacilli bacterium]